MPARGPDSHRLNGRLNLERSGIPTSSGSTAKRVRQAGDPPSDAGSQREFDARAPFEHRQARDGRCCCCRDGARLLVNASPSRRFALAPLHPRADLPHRANASTCRAGPFEVASLGVFLSAPCASAAPWTAVSAWREKPMPTATRRRLGDGGSARAVDLPVARRDGLELDRPPGLRVLPLGLGEGSTTKMYLVAARSALDVPRIRRVSELVVRELVHLEAARSQPEPRAAKSSRREVSSSAPGTGSRTRQRRRPR